MSTVRYDKACKLPTQIQHERLLRTLHEFYAAKNKELNQAIGSASEEEQLQNSRKLHETIKKLKSGEERVELQWFEPMKSGTSSDRTVVRNNSTFLNYRYGVWLKQDFDLD